MNVDELIIELFGRIDEHVDEAIGGIDPELLHTSPAPGTNTVAWLVWHLTRVQDHHMSELLGEEQVWVSGDWASRFGLPADPHNTGYGHTEEQVAAVRPEGPEALRGYYEAVAARTRDFLRGVTPAELDRIVDERWDPPVTLGVRLVSIADDDIQHAGQAAFARGILERS